MKHRMFEFWEYDATMCTETTEHLNEMSENGYELVGISRAFALAGYAKVDEKSDKKYTVIINDTKDKHQEENLIYYDNREGISIYEGDPTGYSEYESFNHLRNNILRKQRKDSPLDLIFLVIAIYRGFPRGLSYMPYMEYFSGLLLWIAVVGIVLMGRISRLINRKEYNYLKKYTSFEDIRSRKYKVYRKHSRLATYILTILLIAMFSISLMMLMTSEEAYITIGAASVLTGVIMVILSLYFILITKNQGMETGLVVVGGSIIFLGFLFTESAVGISIGMLMIFMTFL